MMQRLLAFLFIFFIFTSSNSFAFQLQIGPGLLEAGDDRFRSSVHSDLIWQSGYKISMDAAQMKFGPITQSYYLFSLGKEFGLFYPKNLLGSFGFTYLKEQNAFDSSLMPSFQRTKSLDQSNLGAYFGIKLKNTIGQSISYGLGWESSLFLAGAAGIFLATGRFQTIHAFVGLDL